MVKEPAADKELLLFPQEEHPLTHSLAACVHVRSPLQSVVSHCFQVLVLGHDADLAFDDEWVW